MLATKHTVCTKTKKKQKKSEVNKDHIGTSQQCVTLCEQTTKKKTN
jgi:hypothetical protein